MDFQLPAETSQLSRELGRLTAKRSERLAEFTGFDLDGWLQLLEFGLPGLTRAGGTDIDLVVGLIAVAEAALPGPVVEAQLAIESGSEEALRCLDLGQVVTSVRLRDDTAPAIVPWGAVADVVVEEGTGRLLASQALPPVASEYPIAHGWLRGVSKAVGDPLAPRRWLLRSAALAGLAKGALALAARHATDRRQFGRPLASFQAVQFRLAECLNLVEGLRLCVLDAAWRSASRREDAGVAAGLTWIWAQRAGAKVTEHCHQVFGAFGFCQESGLVALTAQMAWLLSSESDREATRFVLDRRSRATGAPPSRVLPGFAVFR